VKLFGTYQWRDVNFGVGFNTGTGRTLTDFAANPNYSNAGEIPLAIRGGGIRATDGQRTRAPIDMALDLHADYGLEFGGQRLVLLADIFNLTNRREPNNYDTCSDVSFGATNANFGFPLNGCTGSISAFQDPFALRLGVRLDW
jgi:hypothetical protein